MRSNLPLDGFRIEDKPPFLAALLITFQFILKFGEMLVCPIFIARIAGASPQEIISISSMSLIAAAIISIAQAWKRIGPGYFAPANSAVQYFAASIAAAKMGGIAMIAGMTAICGFFQILLTPLFYWLRRALTTSVAGFVVVLMALWLGGMGVRELFQPNQLGQLMLHTDFSTAIVKQAINLRSTTLGFVVLFIMLLIRFYSPIRLRPYTLLFGIGCGWMLNIILGWVPDKLGHIVKATPWFGLPHFHYYGFAFSWHLLPAYLIAGFISVKTVYGMVGSFQAVNDNNNELNLKKIAKANLITGSGVVLSSVLHAYPQNMEPGIAATEHAFGVYNRRLGYFYAAFLLILVFIPKCQVFFLTMPAAVNGAAILYFATIFFITGLYMLDLNRMQAWEMQALAIAILIGSSLDIIPAFYKSHILNYLEVTTPALTFSVITYFILRFLFSYKHKNKESTL